MYTASKKTRVINSFRRTAVIKPRDLYARYGERFNPKAIHGTDATTTSDVIPQGSAVIDQMISAQNLIKAHTKTPEGNNEAQPSRVK